jgi:hypothetical protein
MSRMPLGAEESQNSGRIWVNLRIGKIAQTSNSPVEGFVPAQTENKSGQITNFFAKPYDHITGYVTDIRWHTKEFSDGGTTSGWNITIDTGKEVFVLQLRSTDRPYHRVMNCLISADFDNPIRFVGFLGEYQGKKQKVLLLSQELNAEGKPVWLEPSYAERWLSRAIIEKLRQGLELTEQEEKNVKRTSDGKFDKDYPYIHQKNDGKWSFDAWDDFLYEKMKSEVIPSVIEANQKRGVPTPDDDSIEHQEAAAVAAAGNGSPINNSDDDIPF